MLATWPAKPHLPWFDLEITFAEEYKLRGSSRGNALVSCVSASGTVGNYSRSEGWPSRVVKLMSIMKSVCYGKLILI
jgi:hypothetical protein